MKTKGLQYLLGLVLMVWLIPWLGKPLLPAWFSSSLVQWSSMGFLAVLCPIGALISLSVLADNTAEAATSPCWDSPCQFCFPSLSGEWWLQSLAKGRLQCNHDSETSAQ